MTLMQKKQTQQPTQNELAIERLKNPDTHFILIELSDPVNVTGNGTMAELIGACDIGKDYLLNQLSVEK